MGPIVPTPGPEIAPDPGIAPGAADPVGPDIPDPVPPDESPDPAPADVPPLRSLDERTLAAAAAFPPDRARITGLTPSTLLHPTILHYVQDEWRNY